jgi:hypothetical protein
VQQLYLKLYSSQTSKLSQKTKQLHKNNNTKEREREQETEGHARKKIQPN